MSQSQPHLAAVAGYFHGPLELVDALAPPAHLFVGEAQEKVRHHEALVQFDRFLVGGNRRAVPALGEIRPTLKRIDNEGEGIELMCQPHLAAGLVEASLHGQVQRIPLMRGSVSRIEGQGPPESLFRPPPVQS